MDRAPRRRASRPATATSRCSKKRSGPEEGFCALSRPFQARVVWQKPARMATVGPALSTCVVRGLAGLVRSLNLSSAGLTQLLEIPCRHLRQMFYRHPADFGELARGLHHERRLITFAPIRHR